jgi:hypothetical protein
MLDEGLVPTLNEKFIGVQETTRTLAMGLVPEFLLAGQESALTMVDSISEQMAKEVNRLAKIGKKIAKPLGQSFKAELMKDVAAALAGSRSGRSGRPGRSRGPGGTPASKPHKRGSSPGITKPS